LIAVLLAVNEEGSVAMEYDPMVCQPLAAVLHFEAYTGERFHSYSVMHIIDGNRYIVWRAQRSHVLNN
jgi:hypothetical protein